MSRQDIENGEKQWLEAFNSGDAAGVAACYGKNGRILPPNADIVEGRDALEPFVQAFLDTGAQLSFELLAVYDTPEVCTAVGRYEMTFPAGGDGPDHDSGKFVEVWTRQPGGEWLIQEDIFNSNLPVPTG
jgi:ketosteroid isomerase-like protein